MFDIWNYTKKNIFHWKEVYEDFWENVNVCWLIWQRKIEDHSRGILIHTVILIPARGPEVFGDIENDIFQDLNEL